jgi:alpha-glucosidase
MEMAQPATTSAHVFSTPPHGYQAPGSVTTIEIAASRVCLRTGSATVEVTALAPDLFRVGFFPQGRSVDYSSVAVVSQDWQAGPVTIVEEDDEVTLATSTATAHLSLDPLRIGFTDYTGRAFALDDLIIDLDETASAQLIDLLME